MSKDKDRKGSKAAPLTGLAAALVKAGKLSEKDARETAREKRREEKALGRDEVERLEAEKKAAAEAARQAEARAARERELARVASESHERARLTIEENRHAGGDGGPRRWFYVARDGRVPFVECTDECGRLLLDGKAGVVERPGRGHCVVAGPAALMT